MLARPEGVRVKPHCGDTNFVTRRLKDERNTSKHEHEHDKNEKQKTYVTAGLDTTQDETKEIPAREGDMSEEKTSAPEQVSAKVEKAMNNERDVDDERDYPIMYSTTNRWLPEMGSLTGAKLTTEDALSRLLSALGATMVEKAAVAGAEALEGDLDNLFHDLGSAVIEAGAVDATD